MTTEKITKMIDQKGCVAKTVFYEIFASLKGKRADGSSLLEIIDEDAIAALCFNTTLSIMNEILDNSVFFEKMCKIKEINRIRMRKDLEKMLRIDYPNDSPISKFEEIEQYILDIFLAPMYISDIDI